MTRDEAAQLWPVVKAFSEGKMIEARLRKGISGTIGGWIEPDADFSFHSHWEYRIKPELFEARFILWGNGILDNCGKSTALSEAQIHSGARIVTLREVEEGK